MSIPIRNESSYGWWIASYLARAAWDDEPTPAPLSVHRVWENTILVEAEDREAAYEKAVAVGRAHESGFDEAQGRTGRWVFEGLTELLPVYEPLEDGSEVLWSDYPGMTLAEIRSRVRAKDELSVFNDRDLSVDDASAKRSRLPTRRAHPVGTWIHGGRFVNVDLDVSSPLPVEPLVDALAPFMFALHVEHVGDRHVARLELHDGPTDFDEGLRRILDALDGLPGPAVDALRQADVVLSIGVDAEGPHETSARVAPRVLAEAGRRGVAIEVVVYRPS